MPKRVADLVLAQEIESERLIGWVQLGVAATFAMLYLIAPRPTDAPATMLAPVPIALVIYTAFTIVRLWLAYLRTLPAWLLVVSILADTVLLLSLIWSFHFQYEQPPAFSLKVPTFIYIIVFIALRALRFDYRYVLTAGLAAVVGWMSLVVLAVRMSPPGSVTRSFSTYINGNAILFGAELDKIFTLLMTTAILTIAVRRAHRNLVTAVREEAAGREIRRFLSSGVADAIAKAETVVEAGQATKRDAAILMLDIRGFTQFSMELTPELVVAVLTRYHARVVPIVQAQGGVVDKFLGDGVMATFGAVAPSDRAAADAVCALEAVMGEVDAWHGDLAALGLTSQLAVNGAVAAGRVVFAALGNAERLEYTVIGDAANLAAKLEKHNKTEGSRALVAADTFDLAVAQGYIPSGPIRRRAGARVMGLSEPIDVVILAGNARAQPLSAKI